MLKSEMDVKAFSAVKILSELTLTNTANVARETCPHKRTRKNTNGKSQKMMFVSHNIESVCKAHSCDSPQQEHR